MKEILRQCVSDGLSEMKNIDHHHHIISIPIIIILISIGIANLSWNSNDDLMDGPVTSRIYKWERERTRQSQSKE